MHVARPELTLPPSAQVRRPWLYKSSRFFINPIFGVWSGNLLYAGLENLPEEGPYVLMFKHRSMRDVGAVGTAFLKATGNTSYFLAKNQLFNIPGVGSFLSFINVIPYNRKLTLAQDARANDSATTALEAAAVLTAAPEGTRTKGPEIAKKIHDGGLGMLAVAHGAMLVPVGVEGTETYLGPKAVYFGQPINQDRAKIDRDENKRLFVVESKKVADQIRPGLERAMFGAEMLLRVA